MKKLYFIIIFLFAQNLYSQQIQQFNMVFLNPNLVSPTINEQYETSKIFINHRNQWLGYDKAPVTSSITSTFNFGEHVGFAANYLNDRYGVFNKNEISLNYSYEINFKTSDLIFGLGTKLISNKIDLSNSEIHQNGDNLIDNSQSYFYIKPEADFGISFIKHNFQSTFSIQNLLSSSTKKKSENIKFYRNYNLLFNYKYNLNKNIAILPSFYFTTNLKNPSIVSFSSILSYQDKFKFGLNYNYKNSINAILGISQKYYSIFYTYEFLYSKFRKSNSGSHEILLIFNIFQEKNAKAVF
jgi:type IX secretion system PorP/SprF family membrane protein